MSGIFDNRDNVFLIIIAVIAVCCGIVMGWIRDGKSLENYDNLCFIPLIVGFIFAFIFYYYHKKVTDDRYGKLEE